MAAFFGLFGSGKPSTFLDSDDAKTLGDIEYMRQEKTLRRTFPKTLKNKKGGERITRVSAVEVREMTSNPTPSSNFNFKNAVPTKVAPTKVAPTNGAPTNGASTNGASDLEPQTQSSQPNSESRSAGNSMDMFRNMARSMKKK